MKIFKDNLEIKSYTPNIKVYLNL